VHALQIDAGPIWAARPGAGRQHEVVVADALARREHDAARGAVDRGGPIGRAQLDALLGEERVGAEVQLRILGLELQVRL